MHIIVVVPREMYIFVIARAGQTYDAYLNVRGFKCSMCAGSGRTACGDNVINK